ncbi:MAG: hypothetical protein [Microviridae sp.]|nr:MAG: hypothetical protein [Microviridae sp.]
MVSYFLGVFFALFCSMLSLSWSLFSCCSASSRMASSASVAATAACCRRSVAFFFARRLVIWCCCKIAIVVSSWFVDVPRGTFTSIHIFMCCVRTFVHIFISICSMYDGRRCGIMHDLHCSERVRVRYARRARSYGGHAATPPRDRLCGSEGSRGTAPAGSPGVTSLATSYCVVC